MILGHFLLVIMQIVDSQYCLHQREYSQCLCVGALFSKHFMLIYVYMYKWAYKWVYIIGFGLQSTVIFFYVLALNLYGNRIYAWFIHADRFQVRPKLYATRSMLMIFNSIRASTFYIGKHIWWLPIITLITVLVMSMIFIDNLLDYHIIFFGYE